MNANAAADSPNNAALFEAANSCAEASTRLSTSTSSSGCPAERAETIEDRAEYTAASVFWVPPEARWPELLAAASQPDTDTILDQARTLYRYWPDVGDRLFAETR